MPSGQKECYSHKPRRVLAMVVGLECIIEGTRTSRKIAAVVAAEHLHRKLDLLPRILGPAAAALQSQKCLITQTAFIKSGPQFQA